MGMNFKNTTLNGSENSVKIENVNVSSFVYKK